MNGLNFEDVIDALTSQVAVLSLDGLILHVNKAWKRFAQENGGKDPDAYLGENYLNICKLAAQSGDVHAIEARDCLLSVMSGQSMHRVFVYPCHSPTQERWFELRLDRYGEGVGEEIIVASHVDVRDRVLAEQANAQIRSELAKANQELDRALGRERHIASTDALTGIGNRRRFFELSEHAMAEAKRYQTPVALMLFDIDRFKQINDALGHQVGDDYIRAVAFSARQEFRESDILARYGGDEFIVLMPRTGIESALKIGNRLIDRVRRQHVDQGHPDVNISISMGMAAYPKDAQNLKTLINCADRALYDAKDAGRDRVMAYKAV